MAFTGLWCDCEGRQDKVVVGIPWEVAMEFRDKEKHTWTSAMEYETPGKSRSVELSAFMKAVSCSAVNGAVKLPIMLI